MNVANIVVGTVLNVLDVNEQLLNVRREICTHCDFYNAPNDKCTYCGCPIKKKGRVAKERCPLKKW